MNTWAKAQKRSGLSYDRILNQFNRSTAIPDGVKDEISKSKLFAFFQDPARSHVTQVQRAYIAEILGVDLAAVDPVATAECEMILAYLAEQFGFTTARGPVSQATVRGTRR